MEYGTPRELTLSGRECHVLDFELDRGRYVEIRLVQRGIDLVTRLQPPDGGAPITFDTPTSDSGPEIAAFLTETSGVHTVEICGDGGTGPSAPYDLEVDPPRAPSGADCALARGLLLYSEADESSRAGDGDASIELFSEALAAFRGIRARRPAAWSHVRRGRLAHSLERADDALADYRAAAELYGELDDPRAEAVALSFVGKLLNEQGLPWSAREVHERSLSAAERSNDAGVVARAMENLAVTHEKLGQVLPAIDLSRRQREMAAVAGDVQAEWRSISRVGTVYRVGGDDRRAREAFEEALAFARRHALSERIAESLMDLGRVHLDREESERAILFFRDAERALIEAGSKSARGRRWVELYNNLGRCEWRLGDFARARASYRRALAEVPSAGRDAEVLEALVLINLAWLDIQEGNHRAAERPCTRALALLTVSEIDPNATGALRCLADVEAARGNLETAARHLERAIGIVDAVRRRSALADLRGSVLEAGYSYHERYVDVLMRLHERNPGAGYAARAFEAAEAARARLLLENLAGDATEVRSSAEPRLAARLEGIEHEMSSLESRLFLGSTYEGSGSGATVERRLRDLETERSLVEGRIFASYPNWPTVLETASATLAEVQDALLPTDDVQLVSFFLAEERSFAWIVGRDSLAVEVLPGRLRIDRLARQAALDLRRSDQPHLRIQARFSAQRLAREVLQPVVRHLRAPKVILVLDGSLHYVPFAALPIRGQAISEERWNAGMIHRHELTEIPSASAAIALRRRRTSFRISDMDAAILADPVFRADDQRLRGRGGPEVASRGAPSSRGLGVERVIDAGGFDRLLGSRAEARALSALVAPDRRLTALGFEANRELLLGGQLQRFRILHLAGHGVAHPEFTGLVLSLYDREGRPIDGLIRPYELYGTRLSAELVVLSACSTGLGNEVRGEGLLGLSRGFLYAGASQVLASLWDVDDLATAALMKRFYRALLVDGDPPARALRRAQQALSRDPTWSAPHFWAGFVLQGDGV